MTSTPTARLRLDKQAYGDNPNAWGPRLNTGVMDLVDESWGVAPVVVSADVVLTAQNFATDQARRFVLVLTGAGGFNVTVPTIDKAYLVHNQCAAAVVIKTASGSGAGVLPNTLVAVYCDGVNVVTGGTSAQTATTTSFNPSGDTTSTNVQAAILEVYSDLQAQTASRRNRIVDPGMRISTDAAGTALSLPANGLAYAVDTVLVNNVSSASITAQQVGQITPGGSPNRLRVSVTGPETTVSATRRVEVATWIEGRDTADLLFGTSSAKPVTVRFGVNFPAGNYSLSLLNGAGNRSWVGPFTIASGQAGVDTLVTMIVPGDTTGTWYTDSGGGILVRIALSAGSNKQGVGGWQAGDYTATSAQVNGVQAIQSFDVFDLGLYPTAAVLPGFQLDDYGQDLRRSQRYFTKARVGGATNSDASFSSGQSTTILFALPVTMRIAPALTFADLAGNASRFSDIYGSVCNQIITSGGFSVLDATSFVADFAASGSGLSRWSVFASLNARI